MNRLGENRLLTFLKDMTPTTAATTTMMIEKKKKTREREANDLSPNSTKIVEDYEM